MVATFCNRLNFLGVMQQVLNKQIEKGIVMNLLTNSGYTSEAAMTMLLLHRVECLRIHWLQKTFFLQPINYFKITQVPMLVEE